MFILPARSAVGQRSTRPKTRIVAALLSKSVSEPRCAPIRFTPFSEPRVVPFRILTSHIHANDAGAASLGLRSVKMSTKH